MGKAPRNAARPRVPVPLTDIEEEFRAQLKFLRASCDAFDTGDLDEFRRIALSVRVLVYDWGQSKSVISQLGLKNIVFSAFSNPINPHNLLSGMTLVIMESGPAGAKYLPSLNRFHSVPRLLSFEDWWTEEVFRSPGGVSMSRSGFILHTANQAGGAHVDPSIDTEFYKIAKENEGGWSAFLGSPENPTQIKSLEDLEKACVRHIGFEVLKALEPEWARLRGNRLCDCGSGRKHRYCHGKDV